MSCSVLILTYNEESNIVDCIRSARFSDDIVVFDSFSEDATTKLASAEGARIYQHPFSSYGAQREAARVQVEYRNPWVLAVDADERLESGLSDEILRVISQGRPKVAYSLRRKDYFRGRWIRHASLYPSWHMRLYRHASVHYPERSVHEHPVVDGPTGTLDGHLIHHNFSKGVGQWWSRHVQYAQLEAQEMLKQGGAGALNASALFSKNPVDRRRQLKALSYVLPLRPQLRYLYMMLVRGAVLDGPVGWEYSRMISMYQRITDQIHADLKRSRTQQ